MYFPTIIKSNNFTIFAIVLVPLLVVTITAFAEENNSTNSTDNSNSANSILDQKPFQSPRVFEVLGLSALIIGTITAVTSKIVKRARLVRFKEAHPTGDEQYPGSFWDILREGDFSPSLARFQFLVWTLAVSFVAVSVFFIRYSGGVPFFPDGDLIPENLLGLMGISTATPVVSNVISRLRYDTSISGTYPLRENVGRFATMLFEGNKPTLGRYQMFLWTWISVIFFLFLFFSSVSNAMKEIEVANNDEDIKTNPLGKLAVPDIDSTLILLMGLSQGGYLAAKLAARPSLKITRFVLDKDNKLVNIFGHRFGDKLGIVKKNNEILSTRENGAWKDTRIILDRPVEFNINDIIMIITDDGLSVSEKYNKKLL